MEFVIDANVVIASLIRDSETRKMLFNQNLKLFSTGFLLQELSAHKLEIAEKSGLNEDQLEVLIGIFLKYIELVPEDEFSKQLKTAVEISPDSKDIQYLALAIHRQIPLWTNDKALKKQEMIKVLSTPELISILKEMNLL